MGIGVCWCSSCVARASREDSVLGGGERRERPRMPSRAEEADSPLGPFSTTDVGTTRISMAGTADGRILIFLAG